MGCALQNHLSANQSAVCRSWAGLRGRGGARVEADRSTEESTVGESYRGQATQHAGSHHSAHSLTIKIPSVVPPVGLLCIVLGEEDHLSHTAPQQLQGLNGATRLTEVLQGKDTGQGSDTSTANLHSTPPHSSTQSRAALTTMSVLVTVSLRFDIWSTVPVVIPRLAPPYMGMMRSRGGEGTWWWGQQEEQD